MLMQIQFDFLYTDTQTMGLLLIDPKRLIYLQMFEIWQKTKNFWLGFLDWHYEIKPQNRYLPIFQIQKMRINMKPITKESMEKDRKRALLEMETLRKLMVPSLLSNQKKDSAKLLNPGLPLKQMARNSCCLEDFRMIF